MTAQKSFLGIPIHGDIQYAANATRQDPFELLQEELAKLVAFESFTYLRWNQYTPYFNDGDSCVFRVGDVSIFVPGMSGDEDDYWEEGPFHDLPRSDRSIYVSDEDNAALDKFVGITTPASYDWRTKTHTGADGWVLEPEDPEMITQAIKVSWMIESGKHDVGLLKTFGDHAEIRLRRDRIDVDTYEHE